MKTTLLISGANSALAKDIIAYFKKKNYQLILLTRNKIKTIKPERKIVNIIYDFKSLKQEKKLKDFISKNKIKISAVLHFNGVLDFSTINSISDENFMNVYEANCLSFIKIVQLVNQEILSNSVKSIVTISSVASLGGEKGMSLYSSSKASLNSLVKSFALELVKKNIRVNSIILGNMLKGMGLNMSKFLNDEQMKKLENKHPLGFGKSKDLFYLLEYLVDNERSRWITGSNITLDGGLSI